MLDSTELDGLRATVEAHLPDTAVIWRQTWASDGQGGGTVTWAAAGTVTCRKSLPSGTREVALAGRLGEVATWVVTLAHDAGVTAKDRLVIGSSTLEVVGPTGDPSWNLGKRLLTVEVR